MLRFFTSLRSALRRSNLIHKSSIINHKSFELGSRGMSSVYIIIFIIILTFAIMLSGGGASLFTGNIASPDIPTPTRDPAATPPAGSAPTTTPSGSSTWKITASIGSCIATKPPHILGTMKVEGSENGYIELSVDSPKKIIGTQEFKKPFGSFPITLTNDSGSNTSPWKFSVYSGGTKTADSWSGGTLQKEYIGSPTGCI